MTVASGLVVLTAAPLFWASQALADRADEDWFRHGGSKTEPEVLGKELGTLAQRTLGSGSSNLSPSQLSELRHYFDELGENLGFDGFRSTKKSFDEFLEFLEELEKHGGLGGKRGSQLQMTGTQIRLLREIIEKAAAESGVKRKQ